MSVRFYAFTVMPLLSILIVACAVSDPPPPIKEQSEINTPSYTTTPVPTITSLPLTLTPTEIQTSTSTPTQLPTFTPEPISMPAFEPSVCKFDLNSPISVECGYLIVPENRSKPDSPPIRIHVAIFKSTNPDPKPDPDGEGLRKTRERDARGGDSSEESGG